MIRISDEQCIRWIHVQVKGIKLSTLACIQCIGIKLTTNTFDSNKCYINIFSFPFSFVVRQKIASCLNYENNRVNMNVLCESINTSVLVKLHSVHVLTSLCKHTVPKTSLNLYLKSVKLMLFLKKWVY